LRGRSHSVLLVCWLAAGTAFAAAPVEYTVKLADAHRHLLHVRIHLPEAEGQRDLQLPVWNALYQVRDFAQYVSGLSCRSADGNLPIRQIDKTTWRINAAQPVVDCEYDVIADLPGPFGAQYNQEHAFFNLAEVLMYSVEARAAPVRVAFTGLPAYWLIATPMTASGGSATAPGPGVYTARNYDQMVDSPVEIGAFSQAFVPEGGATYRIVVHAAAGDYDMSRLIDMVRIIVRAETAWMDDRPFTDYLFIFHFPRGPGGGGMEHANAAVIEVNADTAREDPVALASVTAHEFFHLWNVKRIRPQSLEPIDYTREQYSSALWFSEGVTNTVADYVLLRCNLLDETRWLGYLSHKITTLERRPAHATQSAEAASLDAWLEKYPAYGLPERSISYYNKGEVLGVLLDLAVRDATGGQKSLRDVLRWMNRNYAQKHRFFSDTAGVRQAAEAVAGKDLSDFFDNYVSGVAPLPYNQYLKTVGLELQSRKAVSPHAGFVAVRNFDEPPVVAAVDENSDAERQGLTPGDTIVLVNGKVLTGTMEDRIAAMRVGESLKLRVAGRGGRRDLKFKLAGREQEEFLVVNTPAPLTADQRARRAAWLTADDQKPKDLPKGAIRAEGATASPVLACCGGRPE
jgi:predicted metalloprotease with PDZ domain